jgi:hypothetical protein
MIYYFIQYMASASARDEGVEDVIAFSPAGEIANNRAPVITKRTDVDAINYTVFTVSEVKSFVNMANALKENVKGPNDLLVLESGIAEIGGIIEGENFEAGIPRISELVNKIGEILNTKSEGEFPSNTPEGSFFQKLYERIPFSMETITGIFHRIKPGMVKFVNSLGGKIFSRDDDSIRKRRIERMNYIRSNRIPLGDIGFDKIEEEVLPSHIPKLSLKTPQIFNRTEYGENVYDVVQQGKYRFFIKRGKTVPRWVSRASRKTINEPSNKTHATHNKTKVALGHRGGRRSRRRRRREM